MKTLGKDIIITALLCVLSCTSFAQEKVSLSFYQDAKLMMFDDNHNNKAGTLDLIVRLKIQRKQDKYGYLVFIPEFERANIKDAYQRYSLNVGYTFNRIKVPFFRAPLYDLEVTPSIGVGVTDRFKNETFNWACTLELSYRVNDLVKVNLLNQFTHRSDLMDRYNSNIVRYSFFVGLDIKLFKTKDNADDYLFTSR